VSFSESYKLSVLFMFGEFDAWSVFVSSGNPDQRKVRDVEF